MSAPDLRDEIMRAFRGPQVHVDDLPSDDPAVKLGKTCGALFTDGVETLRSVIPNDRIRAHARLIWDLVGNRQVQVAIGPKVPSLSFTCVLQGAAIQGIVVIPEHWPQMIEDDTFMQLGAILFVGAQVVDFYNDRLLEDAAHARWQAYEAELLRTLKKILPAWTPNEYQRQVLVKFPAGLDTPGVVLYPARPFDPPKGNA